MKSKFFLCTTAVALVLCTGCSTNRPQTETEKALGNQIGVIATAGPLSAGYMGSEVAWVAQYLDTETYQISFVRSEARKTVAGVVSEVLQAKGRPTPKNVKGPEFDYAAFVGSGIGGLNPAVVKIAVRQTNDGKTNVVVQGTAKEGLIKQGTSEKAVKAIAYEISERLNTVYLEKEPAVN